MNKRYFLGIAVTFLTLPVCFGAIALAGKSDVQKAYVRATGPTVTLTSAAFGASGLTTTYQQSVKQDFGNERGTINYFLAKKDASNNLVLAPAGKVFNYNSSATYKGRVTNIESITVNYTGGQLFVQEGMAGSYEVYDQKMTMTSNTPVNFKTKPNHFVISNSTAETTITSIQVSYTCEEAGWDIARLGNEYTGMGADSTIYTLTVNNGAVSVAGQSGTIAINNTGKFTMTLAGGTINYSGSVSADYKTLYFTEKTGSNANLVPTIAEMNRVYVVDDFENYTGTGTGFTADRTSTFVASDLRAEYYVDSGAGSGATWITDSTFKIPNTDNYLGLTTTAGRNGSKAMVFEGVSSGWRRLWSSNVFYDQNYNYGSGNKMSFWVHSGYQNADCTGTFGGSVTVKAQVYYDDFTINETTRTSMASGSKDTPVASNSGWQQVVLNLDPTKTVRSIYFGINNSGIGAYGTEVYMVIDDITIYTQPVYEPTKKFDESATRITKTYHGNATVAGQNFTLKVALGANGYIKAYAGADMVATSYTIEGNQITIVTTGSYIGETFGTWVGTLSNNNRTITIPKTGISGSIRSYVSNSTIVLNENNTLIDGSEASIDAIETNVKRQYLSGSWTDDPGHEDRLKVNNDYYIQGNSSIKVRAYGSGNMRVVTQPSFATEHGPFDTLAFWFYAPAGVSYSISIFTYKDTTPSSTSGRYSQINTKTCDGSEGWVFFESGLNKAGGYGKSFAIFVETNSSATILDYVTYF